MSAMNATSAPPSALSSPALPSEVYFSPYAHEYTSYFSVNPAQAASVRRNAPLVQRRSRVVMACTYCRRRKIRCDGAEPCTNCSKSGRSCDYTPVPADLNAIRRRKGLGDTIESGTSVARTTSEGPCGSRTGGVSGLQRLPDVGPSHLPLVSDSAPAMFNANDYPNLQPDSGAREALLPSGYSYGPPSQGPSQVEWALVPVWRSGQPDLPPAPPLMPSPRGFAASRRTGAVPPPLFGGIERPGQEAQTPQQPNRISGYLAQPMDDGGHVGGLSAALCPVPPPTYRPGSAEMMQSTGFLISEQAMPSQQTQYPKAPSTAGTSISSSHEPIGPTSIYTSSSTTTSPPYTPLPPHTGGALTRSFTSNVPLSGQTFAPEDVKHMYPNAPLMVVNMPPTTPRSAAHNVSVFRPQMIADAGVVGLGITMPGV